MLSRKTIVENIDLIRKNNELRNMTIDLEKFLSLDNKVQSVKSEYEEISRQANEHACALKLKKGPPSEEEITIGRALKDKRSSLDEALRTAEAELLELQQAIPNLTDSRAPIGETDASNALLEYGAWPKPEFDFAIRDHLELGALHNLFDFESASRVTGQGFYYLKGDAVRLDLALQLYAMAILERHGFVIHTTPDLARRDLIAGTGYNPRGSETQIYSVENANLGLIATAEITLRWATRTTLPDTI